ncbi:chorismate mutase [Kurthia sibirica]|uniref:chorismate mutase n=1 Tax=Kurthia sibirica TaxID=202750 RepID=A0A2U3AIS1_9BACL|nr:chorismate mutase [Kurthia sibirica]PWI24443.1 chorismate mutase [Kurthia sibirica]GEK35171.1 chorismate mutase AroH [Kurthia sibirica]
MIRGMRGATTITSNDGELVATATTQLLAEIIARNNITADRVSSVIITTTPDITSAFPAKSVRTYEGWNYVPVMCMHEMNVTNALPLCIRLLVNVETSVKQQEIVHVYLHEAMKLRPDLIK